MPRELQFFQDWTDSSAAAHRVFAHWALDTHDYTYKLQQDDSTYKREREVGFVPRPLRVPQERVQMPPDASVHLLMDRVEAIDREVGLPFGWFFLMEHDLWVDLDVGRAIAKGLKAQRVRLPDCDAAVLLRWAEPPQEQRPPAQDRIRH